jgi:uncharacterized protein
MPSTHANSSRSNAPHARALSTPVLAALLVAVLFLSACASTVYTPTVYVLKSEPPVAVPAPSQAASPWQLLLPVRVPDYLDRDALLLPQGAHAVQAAAHALWAEPLSRSVPRVLSEDLRALRGAGSLWTAPLGGVAVQGQLRVALLALDVDPGGRSVSLQAHWSIHPKGAATQTSPQPTAHSTRLTVSSNGPEPADLVAAHRLALWQLAQAISLALPP